MLPPDIREQMKETPAAQRRSGGGGGIGGGAKENVTSARARSFAMDPNAVHEEEAPAAEAKQTEEEDLKSCPRCQVDLHTEWNFCAKCGQDLIRGGAAKKLGITFNEDDVHDYLFKGYVLRDLSILGRFKATVKSSQPSDIDEIDEYIMTGDWRKSKDGKERPVSDFYVQQINTLCMTAASLQKVDGNSIGATLKERMDWLFERGSAIVDMLGQRVILFNRALTDYLKKEDTVLGS